MAGLVPAIHASAESGVSLSRSSLAIGLIDVDGRDTPGHDELVGRQ
jgi:hypothetical protein